MANNEMADGFEYDLGSGSPPAGPHSMRDELIGFSLTFVASLGICFSLNLQKLVHLGNVDPATGQASVSFLTLPLWWVGVLSNAAAELLNLAALGYAPATLVTPLGCLTVVFNCVTSAIFLKEQFLRRDLLGIVFIGAGVVCVVWSQVGSPAPPITPQSLREDVLPSASFWILVGLVMGGLAFIYAFLHEQYRLSSCWIYLAESSLVSTFTVVSARCFASFLPYPMPGEASYFYTSPDCWYTWGSLALLAISAVGGLLLQNAALMHFKASEVVPIYFCMFALSGVAGSGLAFGELRMPWVLMLIPGVALCICGVFAISHRREERIALRISTVRRCPRCERCRSLTPSFPPHRSTRLIGESKRIHSPHRPSAACASGFHGSRIALRASALGTPLPAVPPSGLMLARFRACRCVHPPACAGFIFCSLSVACSSVPARGSLPADFRSSLRLFPARLASYS